MARRAIISRRPPTNADIQVLQERRVIEQPLGFLTASVLGTICYDFQGLGGGGGKVENLGPYFDKVEGQQSYMVYLRY